MIELLKDSELAALLEECRTIAIVGAKDRQGHPVDRVGRYLIDQGFDIIPVHPVRTSVWGIDAVPSLGHLAEAVDIVDLFRAPQFCPDHAREVLDLAVKPRLFWMQSGITSQEAIDILADTSVTVVQDRCLMVEHRRLCS